MPPVGCLMSWPAVDTWISSKLSKLKYVGEAPVAAMSVTTIPSSVQTASCGRVPLEAKLDCWPVSLPPMFTRSTSTPGTERISANGSRDVGIFVSSSEVKLVAVPVAFVSMTGDSPLTVIVSATAAILSVIGSSTFLPTATTMPSRTSVVKPGRTAVTLYGPGARLRKRNSPFDSVVKVRVASTPCAVTRTPGSTPPWSSLITPVRLPP